ncbi:MAG TPA: hypothetical protein VN278_02645 [Methanosarcina sp.]|nr:hypothetical protein [Methanosarcina sp.]
MESTADIEKRLIELDREIIESACGAWDYDVDSEEFVDRLRKSSRLDWIK